MQEPYQPQQYTYDQKPESTSGSEGGWLQKNQSLLIRVGIGALILLVIFLLVIFLINKGKANRLAEQVTRQTRIEKVEKAEVGCDETKNPEKCLENILPDLAQETGDPSYCDGLSGSANDSCLLFAAIAAHNPDICEEVLDDARRTSCSDAALGSIPESEKAYKQCALFSTQDLIDDCQNMWVLRRILSFECDSEIMSNEECIAADIFRRATEAQNPDICSEFGEENNFRPLCIESVGPGDRDHDGLDEYRESLYGTDDLKTDTDEDGLSDYNEINQFGTDPTLSDSDGDGYNDKTEIESGYDPLS